MLFVLVSAVGDTAALPYHRPASSMAPAASEEHPALKANDLAREEKDPARGFVPTKDTAL